MDPTPDLERFESYEHACREFRWRIPQQLNIANTICRRHPDSVTRIALSDVKENGINTYTFGGLDFLSDKFATALSESSIRARDSVAVALPPSAALAIAHLGALKAGAVVVPLSITCDAALLQYALVDSGAKALVVDESIYSAVEVVSGNLANLESLFVVGDLRPTGSSTSFKDFWSEIDRCSSDFEAVETDASSAAFAFYIECQGEIAGVVHSHRSVVGQFAAFEMFNNVEADSVFWTLGDWSSPGAVLGVLYPALWYGCSVVAGAPKDDAGLGRLLEQCEVTNVFIPTPGSTGPGLTATFKVKVRSVVAEASHWPEYFVNNDPSVTLNEVYGRPESGWIYGKCERLFATAAGSVGRPVPGRLLEIIDDNGKALPPRQAGHIAIHKSDPGLFTGYSGASTRAAASFIGDWFLTGDFGYKNEDGNLYISPSPRVVGTD